MRLYNKYLISTFLLALSVRLLFFFFGAEIYFGNSDFHIQGDSASYIASVVNLIEKGVFSVDLEQAEAYAARMPGYPFFIGFFVLIFGSANVAIALKATVFAQIVLSSISAIIFNKIVYAVSSNIRIAFISGIVFATYPFVVVWTPILYAESLSIDLMLFIIYLIVINKEDKWYLYATAGLLSGYGVLVRPQLIFLWASVILFFFFKNKFSFKTTFKQSFSFLLCSIITFSIWPLRNYVNHGKLVFMINKSTSRFMSLDRLNFAYFMWAVKTDWEPQISEILANKEVSIPVWVWEKLPTEDTVKLKRAIQLSQTCADGFAVLKKLPRVNKEIDCSQEVAELWKELRLSVIKHAPFQFFVLVPLSNIKKALFKHELIQSYNRPDKPSNIVILAKMLFSYRSLMLLLGIFGSVWFFSKSSHAFYSINMLIFSYFSITYFWLCFIYRDMDIRYLLPADVLLLFPASFLLAEFYDVSKKLFSK